MANSSTPRPTSVLVVSRYLPEDVPVDKGTKAPLLSDVDQFNDAMDAFNHPRYRRGLILKELAKKHRLVQFMKPKTAAPDFLPYRSVHSPGLIDFLETAWNQWEALGEEGQDPMAILAVNTTSTTPNSTSKRTPPLIIGNVPLPRDPFQRRSANVMGQIGYYCTDSVTPVFQEMKEELQWDVAVMQQAVDNIHQFPVVYALATHPGHHAATDSFGGYCYLNHAAFCAKQLQTQYDLKKVAVLDVDYHAGNGTASIFYADPSVLVLSIHCHPDYDYPFHSGFEDETGDGDAEGATMHLPLLPKTTWNEYSVALEKAMKKVQSFGAEALIVSMGLDTHDGDPCAIRRAGFNMSGQDYVEMGQWIGSYACDIPILVVQEGGYRMDKVPSAAADVLEACAKSK